MLKGLYLIVQEKARITKILDENVTSKEFSDAEIFLLSYEQ